MVVVPLTLMAVNGVFDGGLFDEYSVLIFGLLLMMITGASEDDLIGGVVVIVRIFLNAGSPICSALIKCLFMFAVCLTEMTDEERIVAADVPSIVENEEEAMLDAT
jgi:hypothetical protein